MGNTRVPQKKEKINPDPQSNFNTETPLGRRGFDLDKLSTSFALGRVLELPMLEAFEKKSA